MRSFNIKHQKFNLKLLNATSNRNYVIWSKRGLISITKC